MNNELDIMTESTAVPEVLAEPIVDTAAAVAETASAIDEIGAAVDEIAEEDDLVALTLAAQLAAEEAEEADETPAEEPACECCAEEAPAEEPACECCAEEAPAEEPVCECCAEEAPAEDVPAPEFDEDEEFVPPITFADDYDDPVDDRDDDYYASNAARVRIQLKDEVDAQNEAAEAARAKKRTLGDKIQNFFYHHWITLAVIGILAALLVAAVVAYRISI